MDTYQVWFVTIGLVGVGLLVLVLLKTSPSLTSIRAILEMLNTRSGNILLLAIMSMFFFWETLHLAYYILSMIEVGKLHEDNAIALMAMQFCTTGAFAASMGAMLTMMTGDKSLPSHLPTTATTTTVTVPPATVVETVAQTRPDTQGSE